MNKYTNLDEYNFEIWCNQIENYAQSKGCKYILKYEIDERLEDDNQIDKHIGKMKTKINESLNAKDEKYVSDCKTPKEMIEKLRKSKIMPKDEYNLYDQLIQLKWEKEESVEQFIDNVTKHRAKIQLINDVKDDAKYIHKIVAELPKCLDLLKENLKQQSIMGESMKYYDVCDLVIKMYNAKKSDKNKEASKQDIGAAFMSQHKYKMWCKICRMSNHTTFKCRKNRHNQISQSNTNNPRANSASTETHNTQTR